MLGVIQLDQMPICGPKYLIWSWGVKPLTLTFSRHSLSYWTTGVRDLGWLGSKVNSKLGPGWFCSLILEPEPTHSGTRTWVVGLVRVSSWFLFLKKLTFFCLRSPTFKILMYALFKNFRMYDKGHRHSSRESCKGLLNWLSLLKFVVWLCRFQPWMFGTG